MLSAVSLWQDGRPAPAFDCGACAAPAERPADAARDLFFDPDADAPGPAGTGRGTGDGTSYRTHTLDALLTRLCRPAQVREAHVSGG